MWIRNHPLLCRVRVIHTDVDPYNSNRRFWFSHADWLELLRHSKVVKALKKHRYKWFENWSDSKLLLQVCAKITSTNIQYFNYSNMFFSRQCLILRLIIHIVIIVIPVYFWNEDWYFIVVQVMRYAYVNVYMF